MHFHFDTFDFYTLRSERVGQQYYLEGNLLHHGGGLLLVCQGLVVDDLTGDRLLHVAELLDGAVPVISGGGHDHHHDL